MPFVLSIGEGEAGSGDAQDVRDTGAGKPRGSGGAKGYWIAHDEQGSSYSGKGTYYYSITKSSAVELPSGQYLPQSPAIYSAIEFQDKSDGWTFELPITNVYSLFNIPSGHEISYVRFSLDPEAFQLTNPTTKTKEYYGSHIGTTPPTATYKEYQEGCVDCKNIDSLHSSCSPNMPAKYTCIKANILSRDDCSVMADNVQQYCEGVSGVGGNKNFVSNSIPLDVTLRSIPGFGGCQESPAKNEDKSYRGYGRDWKGSSIQWSPDMLSDFDKSKIGNCCGNDPMDDNGALAVSPNDPGDSRFESGLICINDTNFSSISGSKNGDFLWLAADGNENFKIKYIEQRNKAPAEFAVVSNANDWFVCNTDESGTNNLDGLYKPLKRDMTSKGERIEGVLMEEYEILPMTEQLLAKGTDLLDGSEKSFYETAQGKTYDSGEQDGTEDSIDENTFASEIDTSPGNLIGAGAVSACDKDGDGYDGEWNLAGTGSSMYDYSEECKNPTKPYDCDDGTFSSQGVYSMTSLSRKTHPGATDYCAKDGTDNNLDCNSKTPCIKLSLQNKKSKEFETNPDAEYLYPRFMCHNVDAKGDFAECCGDDLNYCFNKDQGRREGAAIHTLREFSFFGAQPSTLTETEYNARARDNYVLRYGINIPPDERPAPEPYGTQGKQKYVAPDDAFTLPLYSDNHDLNITDWSHYKNLEFYVWFTTNFEVELWLMKKQPDLKKYVYSSYKPIYKFRIVDYVVNEPELMKWLHVIIPTNEVAIPTFKPDALVFASNVRKLMALDHSVKLKGSKSGTYSNVIGVDKIHFTPESSDLPSGAENFFCTGTWAPEWVDDLDDTNPADLGNELLGQSACEAIPSYGWTGNRCCGDDTGTDVKYNSPTDKIIGMETQRKEYYADSRAGCWAGNRIAENETIMMVKYNMYYSGPSGTMERLCRNTTCVYSIPQLKNILITNDYTDIYDFYYVNGGRKAIKAGALSPSDKVALKVENVPMQVLFQNKQYWGCNAAQYLLDIDTASDGTKDSPATKLIPSGNNVKSEGAVCKTQGGHFCDHVDGANLGWSDEPAYAYGNNITLRKTGGAFELKKLKVSGVVPPTERIEAKKGFNLIENGGFENV
jgi:hypothetical protein